MIQPSASPALTLNIRRVLRASPSRVFRAWTEPAEIKRWFAAAEGYTTPIAEVDLRIGGRFRIGMQAPDSNELSVATGVYQEIVPSSRLVLTWHWEHDNTETPLTRLTLEFRPHRDGTELVLVHEGFADAATQEQHVGGWQGCLDSLERMINRS